MSSMRYLATVGLISVCVAGAYFSVTSKAMRGTDRKPFPRWLDRLCRLTFVWICASPALLYFPYPGLTATLVVLYLPSYLSGCEKDGVGRPSPWMMSWSIFHWVARYFDHSCFLTNPDEPIDPKRQYIFALHPHGILPLGGIWTFATLELPESASSKVLTGITSRSLAASFIFYIPFYRDLCLASSIVDAARYSAKRVLSTGRSLVLVPGGASEALYSQPGHATLVLKKRSGFIKLALETGSALVPVFSFGENDMYNQVSSENKLLHSLKMGFQAVFGISLPLVTHFIPNKCKITTVVGKPIAVEKVTEPTKEQVQALLDHYCDDIKALYLKHRKEVAPHYSEDIEIL